MYFQTDYWFRYPASIMCGAWFPSYHDSLGKRNPLISRQADLGLPLLSAHIFSHWFSTQLSCNPQNVSNSTKERNFDCHLSSFCESQMCQNTCRKFKIIYFGDPYCKCKVLKGNPADVPHLSVFTGVREYFCICELKQSPLWLQNSTSYLLPDPNHLPNCWHCG